MDPHVYRPSLVLLQCLLLELYLKSKQYKNVRNHKKNIAETQNNICIVTRWICPGKIFLHFVVCIHVSTGVNLVQQCGYHSCWMVASQAVVFKLVSSTPKQILLFLAVAPQLLFVQSLQLCVNSVKTTSVSGTSLSWSQEGIHLYLLMHLHQYLILTKLGFSGLAQTIYILLLQLHFSEATHNHFLYDLVKHLQLQYWDSLYWECSSIINILPFRREHL